MARRIFITPQASIDLDDIYNFIAQSNPDMKYWIAKSIYYL